MDSALTKYILFAIGLLILIIIITVLVMSISGVTGIYGQVTKTDISIRNKVDNLIHKYDDNVFNGVDVVNALKIYEDEENVEVRFTGEAEDIKDAFKDQEDEFYSRLSEYVNLAMHSSIDPNSIDPSVKAAIPDRCKYQQLFICDVTQTGSNYEVTFDYYIP